MSSIRREPDLISIVIRLTPDATNVGKELDDELPVAIHTGFTARET